MNIFKNKEFGEIGIIVKNNKEYFEAIRVAKILGYKNPHDAVNRHCIKEGLVFHEVVSNTRKKRDGSKVVQLIDKKFIDEGNLYRLIIKSKLEGATRFERWLVEEVLPSIRKNGFYIENEILEKTLEDPNFLINVITDLKLEKERRIVIQEKINKLESKIKIDSPYTNFGKSISASTDAITIGQFAKILNNNSIKIGRNRLFSWFRENGYLIKRGQEKNLPKQIYIEQGLFKLCEKLVCTKNGVKLSTTTLITGKGQVYFLELICKADDYVTHYN